MTTNIVDPMGEAWDAALMPILFHLRPIHIVWADERRTEVSVSATDVAVWSIEWACLLKLQNADDDDG